MQKIPTIFKRDLSLKCTPVTDEPNPDCQWVFDGEGIATRKIDGINVKGDGSQFLMRVKPSTEDYTEAEYAPFKDKFVDAAILNNPLRFTPGVYEAYGENIRGNPERLEGYHLVRIAPRPDMALKLTQEPKRTYRDLMGYFATNDIEGIVYHRGNGQMAKIKTKDFYHLARP